MQHISAMASSAFGMLVFLVAAPCARAQITNQIDVRIHHPFIVGNTTLPSGHYQFHMLEKSGLSAMVATNISDGASTEFLVRMSQDSHTPRHTELVFNQYGRKDFLSDIYEDGSKIGVAVDDPSWEESRLQKAGEKPTPQTEEETQ